MAKITIPAKMSNSGSIYDLASEHYDRVITFGTRWQFAVVVPSYYNVRHSVHATEAAAVRAAKSLRGYSPTIIDRAGDEYQLAYGELCFERRGAFEVL